VKDPKSVGPIVADLRALLKDDDPEVRAYAALSLAELGENTNEVRSALKEAQKSDDKRIRDNAVKALKRIS
jgi:HEAT repeat protein